MNTTKRKRLEAAGWKVGTVDQFLGLRRQEAALIEMKLALADRLRQSRSNVGLTQNKLAKRIRSSQSRVAKMEAGDRSVSFDLLFSALLTLGVSPRQIARTLATTDAKTRSVAVRSNRSRSASKATLRR